MTKISRGFFLLYQLYLLNILQETHRQGAISLSHLTPIVLVQIIIFHIKTNDIVLVIFR